MIPDLQSSLLCDDVRQERNGKFMLIGLFEGLVVNQLPGMFPKICVVNRWCSGQGDFTQRTRIVSDDGRNRVCEGQPIPIKLESDLQTSTSVEVFMHLQFQSEGNYWVEVLLNDQLKIRYPLAVRLAPKQPPQQQPQG